MTIHLKRYQAKLGLPLLGMLVLLACSPAPMPVSQSSRDPSNPNAPEGVTPATVVHSAMTTSSSEHAGHAHEGGNAGDAGAVTYVCPMHPEVSSNAPGVCPKCNMKLVPKK